MKAKILSVIQWFRNNEGKDVYKVNIQLENGEVCTLIRTGDQIPSPGVSSCTISFEPSVYNGKLVGKLKVSW